MGIDIAIDELVATGWCALDSAGCATASDGRWYPTPARAIEEFRAAGLQLTFEELPDFGCVRGSWGPARDPADRHQGSVMSQSVDEAAIFALARMRRELVPA